jgi:hypothetical protein
MLAWLLSARARRFSMLLQMRTVTTIQASIPDIVMSNNTGPEYGSEGEKSHVRTSDAESHRRLAG